MFNSVIDSVFPSNAPGIREATRTKVITEAVSVQDSLRFGHRLE